MNASEIKILITDDSEFMRQFIGGYLRELGYAKIIEAPNGQVAVEKFKLEKPDVVLLDLLMPIMDGEAALAELVKQNAKVIVISEVGQKTVIERVLSNGAKHFFVKPFFDKAALDAEIKSAIA